VCDLETSRMGAPYIYDISRLRVKSHLLFAGVIRSSPFLHVSRIRVNTEWNPVVGFCEVL